MTAKEQSDVGGDPGQLAVSASVLMTHEVGLHARPSVTLTKLAKTFEANIEIGLSPTGPWVNAKSVARVMRMKAPKGTVLYFQASGEDAGNALSALKALVDNDFELE